MPKIDEIYGFVCDDQGPDDEGIIGAMTAAGWMPLIGADVARTEAVRQAAEATAKATGKKVKLVRWSQRTVLEEDILKNG